VKSESVTNTHSQDHKEGITPQASAITSAVRDSSSFCE
jgi:hypothetical protein